MQKKLRPWLRHDSRPTEEMAIRKSQAGIEYRAALAKAFEDGASSVKQSAEYVSLVAGAGSSSSGVAALEKRVADLESSLKKAKSKAYKRKKKNKKLADRVKELEGAGASSGSSSGTKSPKILETVEENPAAEEAEVSRSVAEERENPDTVMADAEKPAETEAATPEGDEGFVDDSSETPTI